MIFNIGTNTKNIYITSERAKRKETRQEKRGSIPTLPMQALWNHVKYYIITFILKKIKIGGKLLFYYFYFFLMINHLDQSSNRDSECRLYEWKYNSKDVFEDYLDWCDKRRAFQLQVIELLLFIIIIITIILH